MSYKVYLLLEDETVYSEIVPTWACARCIISEADVLAYQVYEFHPGDKRMALYEIGGLTEHLVKIDEQLDSELLNEACYIG